MAFLSFLFLLLTTELITACGVKLPPRPPLPVTPQQSDKNITARSPVSSSQSLNKGAPSSLVLDPSLIPKQGTNALPPNSSPSGNSQNDQPEPMKAFDYLPNHPQIPFTPNIPGQGPNNPNPQ